MCKFRTDQCQMSVLKIRGIPGLTFAIARLKMNRNTPTNPNVSPGILKTKPENPGLTSLSFGLSDLLHQQVLRKTSSRPGPTASRRSRRAPTAELPPTTQNLQNQRLRKRRAGAADNGPHAPKEEEKRRAIASMRSSELQRTSGPCRASRCCSPSPSPCRKCRSRPNARRPQRTGCCSGCRS